MFKKAVLSNKFSSIQLRKVAAGYKQVQPRIEGSKENETFTKEFTDRRIKLSAGQKFFLGTGSSIAALVDPRRHDMIAALGETTSIGALAKQHELMKSTPEGLLILTQKPRINTKTINLDELRNLSETTLGFSYQKFLAKNNVTPDSRLDVRFMDDPQLAYLMTRYRECHDLIHTILGMPTNMLGEVTVKWVEALNIGLPMCYGAAIFGAMRLHPKQRKLYKTHYLPWAIENGKNMKLLMSVYWEHRWEQDVSDLRHELNIRPFPCDT